MLTSIERDEYLAELREKVCSRCVQRCPECPPCGPNHKPCGIELHLQELVDICRTTDSIQMATYLDKLHDAICPTCDYRNSNSCPCPLDYLLQLAVEAVETVECRRK